MKYHSYLLGKRMSELTYVVENKMVSEIEKASNRVSFEAGKAVENWEKTKAYDDKNKLRQKIEFYKGYLPDLRDKFPANSSYWLLIQQNIDSFGILLDKLK